MDLFAGPGFDKDRDTGEVVDGSPVLALKLHPGFRRFVFIDKDRACTTQLRDLAFDRRLDEMTHLLTGDCNSLIGQALVHVPTDGATFAFVDPAGVHLDWATVRAIASHKPEPRRKIELFVLFPYDMALVRFLTLDKTPEEIWGPEIEHRLDATMPDAVRWRRVYQARRDGEIDPEETRRRFAYLYWMGFRELGYKHVLNPKRMASETGHPLYFLFFASDHDVGEKIMSHILEKQHAPAQFQLELPGLPVIEDPWDFKEGEAWYQEV